MSQSTILESGDVTTYNIQQSILPNMCPERLNGVFPKWSRTFTEFSELINH